MGSAAAQVRKELSEIVREEESVEEQGQGGPSSSKKTPPLSVICSVPPLPQDLPSNIPSVQDLLTSVNKAQVDFLRGRSTDCGSSVGLGFPEKATGSQPAKQCLLSAPDPQSRISRLSLHSDCGTGKIMARLRLETIATFSDSVPSFANANDAANAAALFVLKLPPSVTDAEACGKSSNLEADPYGGLKDQMSQLRRCASELFYHQHKASFVGLMLLDCTCLELQSLPPAVLDFCDKYGLEQVPVLNSMDMRDPLAAVAALIPLREEAKAWETQARRTTEETELDSRAAARAISPILSVSRAKATINDTIVHVTRKISTFVRSRSVSTCSSRVQSPESEREDRHLKVLPQQGNATGNASLTTLA
eukprot:gnl/TRDRNA2_/TRDRNA2_209794_c0_seq1.p1 gnl/TRDRNA2_/TRDRNA2_209794_c0~~gnl/TRDRNA2_/TRDRNA2_209794_c0_seq1.p1  ORF type:complete len:395 (+),score=68.61 gnl/TRDRNA2_/TRDRNA2_209794_c0_seq1:96-1187(+)